VFSNDLTRVQGFGGGIVETSSQGSLDAFSRLLSAEMGQAPASGMPAVGGTESTGVMGAIKSFGQGYMNAEKEMKAQLESMKNFGQPTTSPLADLALVDGNVAQFKAMAGQGSSVQSLNPLASNPLASIGGSALGNTGSLGGAGGYGGYSGDAPFGTNSSSGSLSGVGASGGNTAAYGGYNSYGLGGGLGANGAASNEVALDQHGGGGTGNPMIDSMAQMSNQILAKAQQENQRLMALNETFGKTQQFHTFGEVALNVVRGAVSSLQKMG
jgi:hypothetical protein